MLNPEKISQKGHFSTLLFMYFRLFTLPQKKTDSSCYNAALAVYFLLFSASYYPHSPITACGGGCVLIRTCFCSCQRLVATWTEFQHSVVYYATDQCRKRLESCVNAEGGH